MKISALNILVRFGSLTRPKFGTAEYVSASLFYKKKKLLEKYHRCRTKKINKKNKLQVWIENVSIGSASKKKLLLE